MILRGSRTAARSWLLVNTLLLLLIGAVNLHAQDRMSPIPPEKWTDAQREVISQAFPGSTSSLTGPYGAWLRSPQVMRGRRIVGSYLLGYEGVLPPKLTEIAVLMAARHWTSQFIWRAHTRLALEAGVGPDLMQAIAEGRRPPDMAEDEAMIYDFCDELLRNQSISDATCPRARDDRGTGHRRGGGRDRPLGHECHDAERGPCASSRRCACTIGAFPSLTPPALPAGPRGRWTKPRIGCSRALITRAMTRWRTLRATLVPSRGGSPLKRRNS